MDNSQVSAYNQDLNGNFHDAHNPNPYRTSTASSNGSSMAEASNMPTPFIPTSVLDASMLDTTGNGMSAQDASNILPGGYNLGNSNGASAQDFQAAKLMKVLGEPVV